MIDASSFTNEVWRNAPQLVPKVWKNAANDVIGAVASHFIRRGMLQAMGLVVDIPYEGIVRDVYASIPAAREGYAQAVTVAHNPNCLCRQQAIILSCICLQQQRAGSMNGREFHEAVAANLHVLDDYMSDRS